MKFKVIIMVLFSFVLVLGLQAQKSKKNKKLVLSGFVKDSKDQPIANAMVRVNNSETTKMTDDRGYYKFRIDPSAEKVIVITPENGYAETKYSGEVALDFIFPAVINELDNQQATEDEMVDLGYVKSMKKSSSYNLPTIDGRKVNPSKYNTVYDMIRAELPRRYKPNSQTLYIVDGSSMQGGSWVIANIPPNEIKSVTILDGAAKVAYGSRGFYGVIVINTIAYANEKGL